LRGQGTPNTVRNGPEPTVQKSRPSAGNVKTIETQLPDELRSSRGENPEPRSLPEVDDEVERAQKCAITAPNGPPKLPEIYNKFTKNPLAGCKRRVPTK